VPDFPLALREKLQRDGMVVLVTDRWIAQIADTESCRSASTRTIWIDLSVGRDAVWKNLNSIWRYNVGLGRRRGVTVDVTTSSDEIARFATLCKRVADRKGFVFPGSRRLMEQLLRYNGSDIEAGLFLARCKGSVHGGVFIIRCGRSLHYFWGGTDRSLPQVRASEAAHWAAIEWGLAKGCTRYDLEGIDRKRNSGTYVFKKKMGGTEVILPGKRFIPIGKYGRVVSWLAARAVK
jgi:lipid II:glycine glycyltransferase (peptidoglycan interpeptide bridge formation enzyme)